MKFICHWKNRKTSSLRGAENASVYLKILWNKTESDLTLTGVIPSLLVIWNKRTFFDMLNMKEDNPSYKEYSVQKILKNQNQPVKFVRNALILIVDGKENGPTMFTS